MGSATNFNSLSKNPAVWPARQTCTMSLRNHGSSPNTSEPMTIQSLAADVALTLEKQLGQGPVHVVGHSLGGKVAMVLALEHPHLVEKLVVADIAPANYSTASPQWSEVVQVCEIVASIDPSGFQNRADCSAALADKGLGKDKTALIMQNLLPRPEGGYAWRVNGPVILESLPLLAQFPDYPRGTEGPPALFIAGGKSSYIAPEHHAEIERLFPDVKHAVIPHAGHWVHAEAPMEFIGLVRDFLA
ncbi:ABHD11 [Symbiodinium sp. KB8]|nr:ABHD11 [Symbiodinium sp. KB8]